MDISAENNVFAYLSYTFPILRTCEKVKCAEGQLLTNPVAYIVSSVTT